MDKKISIILKASQEYFRHTEDDFLNNAPIMAKFFESVSNIYIPLLEFLEKKEKQNNFCFCLVLPPVLCNLLSNEILQNEYIEWLNKKNQLGQKELLRNKDNEEKLNLINFEIEKNNKLKILFTEKYQKNLIPSFRNFMHKGLIELLGTCGTELFIPHYAEFPEIISAQIETGLFSYKKNFGLIPEGFWLPQLGYLPGVEKIIKAYGYLYTIVDSKSFLLANDLPKYGTFEPCRTDNLVVFANDYFLDDFLYGEKGVIHNSVYKNQNSDIGFELALEELSPILQEGSLRFSTGFTYKNKNFDNNTNSTYNIDSAQKQIKEDAKRFISVQKDRLEKVSDYLDGKDFALEVCAFDLEKLSKNWYECIDFIESIIDLAWENNLEVSSCSKICDDLYSFEKIDLHYSADAGEGYGENLLSSKNSWMMRYIYKACERMIDLAERFPSDSGLKNRLLNLGAQELLLSLSSKLAQYMDDSDFLEYAERRFTESIVAFTYIFDALGSNTVSTEWLTRIEAKDSVFPWMNYKIFAKKK